MEAQVKAGIKKYAKVFKEAADKNLNEGVITALCRELRTLTGTRVPEEDVFTALKGLIKESVLLADLKIRRKPKPVKGATEVAATEEP